MLSIFFERTLDQFLIHYDEFIHFIIKFKMF